MLTNWKGPDLIGYGELVLEGTFRIQRAKNERTLFLFDKLLLITKKREETYTYKAHILVRAHIRMLVSPAGQPGQGGQAVFQVMEAFFLLVVRLCQGAPPGQPCPHRPVAQLINKLDQLGLAIVLKGTFTVEMTEFGWCENVFPNCNCVQMNPANEPLHCSRLVKRESKLTLARILQMRR